MQAGGQGGIDPAERPQVGAQPGSPPGALGAGPQVLGELAGFGGVEGERRGGGGEIERPSVGRHRIASESLSASGSGDSAS